MKPKRDDTGPYDKGGKVFFHEMRDGWVDDYDREHIDMLFPSLVNAYVLASCVAANEIIERVIMASNKEGK